MQYEIINVEQGSAEWHALRKSKITATDAVVIMGASPWKTKTQLYHEKLSDLEPAVPNERMQRGIDLEPIARDMFILESGIKVNPAVVVKQWAMASLDGMSEDGHCILEIKCPGEKDHAIALQGKVPDYYYAQLQHQMYVTGLDEALYYSFDGLMGCIVFVNRDQAYIEAMVTKEMEFYECLINRIPPEEEGPAYIHREDSAWEQCAARWRSLTESIRQLEKEEQEVREQLIALSGQYNCKGAGISLCQIERKGNVDYSKIPELKSLNLDLYRKPVTISWRISCQ